MFGAAVLLAAIRTMIRVQPDRPTEAAACGLLMSAVVIANVSYGTWQNWWLATLAISTAFLAATFRTRGQAT
jgi:hypothetical protein